MEQLKERNHYVDFLRGLATFGVIVIHTSFWSGQLYTPPWFWNITLFLDVPFFFYLSGWASGFRTSDIRKTGRSILGIWLKWIFFATLLAVFTNISTYLPWTFQGLKSVRELVQNYMFNITFPGFPVVEGSLWFLPIYFVVILGNTAVMVLLQKSNRFEAHKHTYMWLLLGCFIWTSFGKSIIGLDLVTFCFFGFFWMMGMNHVGKVRDWKRLLLVLVLAVAGICFFSYVQELKLSDIQSAKMPPTMKYLFVSLPIIFVTKMYEPYYRGVLKWFEHVGRNAIFYFFAQGVGASLCYLLINKLHMGWPLKWCIVLLFNLIVSTIIAETVAILYHWVSKCMKSLWEKVLYVF